MPFWSRQWWCWFLWASWSSNRTTRFSLGFYFLGRGPSGDGATGVGEIMNFIGGRASLAAKSSSMSFVQLRTGPERPNRASRQRISERGYAEHKGDRGLRRYG